MNENVHKKGQRLMHYNFPLLEMMPIYVSLIRSTVSVGLAKGWVRLSIVGNVHRLNLSPIYSVITSKIAT